MCRYRVLDILVFKQVSRIETRANERKGMGISTRRSKLKLKIMKLYKVSNGKLQTTYIFALTRQNAILKWMNSTDEIFHDKIDCTIICNKEDILKSE
jgi:hypothetical protein